MRGWAVMWRKGGCNSKGPGRKNHRIRCNALRSGGGAIIRRARGNTWLARRQSGVRCPQGGGDDLFDRSAGHGTGRCALARVAKHQRNSNKPG